MMARATLLLVLIVSCAHAMVHVFEFALPSVEQLVAKDYGVSKQFMGTLSASWRLPFGFGALAAGWLVDHWGARRLLAVYLLGSAGMSLLAGLSLPVSSLFIVMFAMGTFASIYHPAGLSLISHETNVMNRARALGIHGIFGSCGIASAPFIAGIMLTLTQSWHAYYRLLALPSAALGFYFLAHCLKRSAGGPRVGDSVIPADPIEDHSNWNSYFALTVLGMMLGFTYAAVLSFLPRYIDGAGIRIESIPAAGLRNYLAGAVLIIGCVGQYTAGRWARHEQLERQLAIISFASAPCLLWMAIAVGRDRLLATALFSLIHFMHQPIYNSLVAKYSPRRRRSLAYGFSFAVSFGLGSLGALFAGYSSSDVFLHSTLAFLTGLAGFWAAMLAYWNRPRRIE
jgi:MFS family permease